MIRAHRREGREGDNKVVMMISYAYPPMGSPGALRAAKFAKYLPGQSWTPIVVTTRDGYCKAGGLEDHVDLPGVKVVRSYDFGAIKRNLAVPAHVGGSRPKKAFSAMMKRLLVPDRDITWYPFGVLAAHRAAREAKVDALYSTSPNITNHLIAGRLARGLGLPWVADFRDLWTVDPFYRERGWRRRVEKRIERRILCQANRITVVSEGLLAVLGEAYPEARPKMSVIRNGFDHADVAGLRPSPPRNRLVLAYSGMFYGGMRNSEPLLRALGDLKRSGVLSSDNFQFNILGLPEPQVVEQVRRFDLGELVTLMGYLPYRDSLARLAESSFVVVIASTQAGSWGQMPTKFYEGLGVRRPILVLAPETYEMATVVKRLGAGSVINPDDSEAFAKWVVGQLRRLPENGPLPDLPPETVGQFTRAEAASQLARILDELLVWPGPQPNRAAAASAQAAQKFHRQTL